MLLGLQGHLCIPGVGLEGSAGGFEFSTRVWLCGEGGRLALVSQFVPHRAGMGSLCVGAVSVPQPQAGNPGMLWLGRDLKAHPVRDGLRDLKYPCHGHFWVVVNKHFL